MTQADDPSIVIAYYRNPRSGKVERHVMSSVTYAEAVNPMMVEGNPTESGEENLWSLTPPEDVDPREIADMGPKPFIAVTPPAQPPPAFSTRSPDILKRAQAAAPPAPSASKRRG